MPLYEYLCPGGHRSERVRPLAESALGASCPLCGEAAQRILSPVRVSADYPGYASPITGEWIEGKRAHREDLARHNCRLYEPGETEEAPKRRAEARARAEAKMDDAVERLAGEMGISR